MGGDLSFLLGIQEMMGQKNNLSNFAARILEFFVLIFGPQGAGDGSEWTHGTKPAREGISCAVSA